MGVVGKQKTFAEPSDDRANEFINHLASSGILTGAVGSSLLLFFVYTVTAILSYFFAIPDTQSAVFWIPTGLTFALFVRARFAPRLWTGWLLAIFVAEFIIIFYYRSLPPPVAVGWAAANVLHPLICGALAWKYFRRPFTVTRMRDVLAIVLLALASGIPSSYLAAYTARFGMEVASLSSFAFSWGISDALGLILMGPLILSWTTSHHRPLGKPLEAILFFLVLSLLSVLIFFRREFGGLNLSLPLIPFFLVAWGSVRFGPRATTLSVVLVDCAMVGAAAMNRGPLAAFGLPPELQLLNLEILIIGSGLISLLLATAVEELLRAKLTAERALLVRDEFLSVASHELHTPVTSLLLSVQGLRSKKFKDPVNSEYLLRLIERQTDKLTQLIRDLLDFNRIHDGALQLELERVDLTEVIRDMIELISEVASENGCEIIFHPEGPVIGHWDRRGIEQILTNLLSNAVKFGPGKPIEITVRTEGESIAVLSVKDAGIGIPKENQPFLFRRFAPVHVRHYGGLGLGLYITDSLVRMLGGSIEVQSSTGEGATFTIRLPLARPIANLQVETADVRESRSNV
jgi:signal transduction histidine kinase